MTIEEACEVNDGIVVGPHDENCPCLNCAADQACLTCGKIKPLVEFVAKSKIVLSCEACRKAYGVEMAARRKVVAAAREKVVSFLEKRPKSNENQIQAATGLDDDTMYAALTGLKKRQQVEQSGRPGSRTATKWRLARR